MSNWVGAQYKLDFGIVDNVFIYSIRQKFGMHGMENYYGHTRGTNADGIEGYFICFKVRGAKNNKEMYISDEKFKEYKRKYSLAQMLD
jgi:hypothetical protein